MWGGRGWGRPGRRLNRARRITAEGTDTAAGAPSARGEVGCNGMGKGAAAAVGRRTGAPAAVGTEGCAAAGRVGEGAPGCRSCRHGPDGDCHLLDVCSSPVLKWQGPPVGEVPARPPDADPRRGQGSHRRCPLIRMG